MSITTARPRLAIFASHPTQYQAPVFRALAERPDVDPTVLFGSDHGARESYDSGFGQTVRWDIPLVDGYRHEFLRNTARRKDVNSFTGISVPGVRERITRESFDAALIMGWQTRGHVQAILAARHARIPTLLLGDSTLEMRPAKQWKAWLRAVAWLPARQMIYSSFLERIDGVLTVGSRNEAYFRSFGVSNERMFRAGHAVENERFGLNPAAKALARSDIRSELGFAASDFVFISVAKLQDRKRPFDLLDAFGEAAAVRPEAALVYVGDGPLRQELAAAVRQRHLEDRVRIAGFVNQADLPRWYAAADCMVLPSDSRETWGLAVNEALASGMPVIVSDAVGCAPDLVIDGQNGKVFTFGDAAALSRAMVWTAGLSPEARSQMAQVAVASVADYAPSRVAERIAESICKVIAQQQADR
ncbi:MAG: glycosyltransferase family 4 protein [Gemmatimonadales bacterium]